MVTGAGWLMWTGVLSECAGSNPVTGTGRFESVTWKKGCLWGKLHTVQATNVHKGEIPWLLMEMVQSDGSVSQHVPL